MGKNRTNQIAKIINKYSTLVNGVCVLVVQSCLTLCNPMDYSPPVSSVHGTLQARILVWVAIPFSRMMYWVCQKVRLGFSITSYAEVFLGEVGRVLMSAAYFEMHQKTRWLNGWKRGWIHDKASAAERQHCSV